MRLLLKGDPYMIECRKVVTFAILTLFLAVLGANTAIAGAIKKDGDFYKIKVSTVKKGAGMVAKITISAKPGYHANNEYPWKVIPTASEGISFAKAKYVKADAKVFSAAKVVFEIPYTITGKAKKVEAQIKFSMCDEKQCEMKKVTVSWPAQ